MRSLIKRSVLTAEQAIHAKRHRDPQGAECLTCLKLVDREGICDGQSLNFGANVQPREYVDFIIECHGRSEAVRVEMGSREWVIGDAMSKFRRVGYFDPYQFEGVKVSGAADVSRELEEPERKPLVVVPG